MRKNLFKPFKLIWQAILTWWDSWTELFVMNLIVLVCWLTVILGPPATFGLYAVVHEIIDEGSSPGLRGLWEGAKKYAVRSYLWFVANLLVIIFGLYAFAFYAALNQVWSEIVRWVLFFIFIAWIFFIQFYTIPFMMEQEVKSLRIAWRNATLTFLASPFYSIVIVVVVNAMTVVGVLTMVVLFFAIPVLPAILATLSVRERLETFGKMSAK